MLYLFVSLSLTLPHPVTRVPGQECLTVGGFAKHVHPCCIDATDHRKQKSLGCLFA